MIFALNRETPGFIILSRRTENGFGEVLCEEQATTQEDLWLVTEHRYNAKGQLIRSQTADMSPVVREHDVVGHTVKETVVLVEPATPQNSRITTYAYAIEKSEDGVYNTTTVTGYNAAGEPLTSTQSTLASQTSGTLERKSITVDIDGNARRQWTEYGTGTERVQKSQIPTSDAIATVSIIDGFTTQQIDHQGVTNAYTRTFKAEGVLQTQTDGRGNVTTAETDIAGRTVKITDAAGNVQTIAYDPATGQPSVLTDALGKQTCYAYDQRGRKTAEWGTNIQTVSYGYDDADQLVKLTTYRAGTGDITTNPTGRTDGDVTTWKYDAATGLELRKTYADGTHMDKTYDSLNRLASITSPRGIITTYTYAPLTGELQTTAHSDSTPGSSASYNHLGQLATLTDPSGTRTFAYNAKGRLQQETLALNGATLNLFESYDEYGRNTAYLLNRRPSSGPVELLTSGMWRWDGSGRLTQAGIFSDREIQYSYLPGTHLLAGITLDNGVSMARSYEPHRDLITGIAYRKEDGTHLATRTYAYDALGRPTARTQQRGTETPRQDAFGYNTRSELTSASIGQAAFAYAFDNIGNRKTAQQTTEHLTYATNPLNQYTSITPQQQPAFAPAFDADGNQTRLCTTTGEWNIVYDANNRPIRFTKVDGSVIVENGYDSMGRRYMQKVTENGTVTRHERYLYRGYLQIAALDILHGGKQKHALFWDPTEPLATRPLILLASDDNRYTYAHDLTKNVTELLDAEGNIAATYDYDPFGKGTKAGVGAGLNPIRWSSEVYDAELGLVYYNYRHYNPADGRWINRDPIAERGGMNLYGFVGNNAMASVDLLGLKYSEMIKRMTMKELQQLYHESVGAYTGAVMGRKMAQPEFAANSQDRIIESQKPGKCCAQIKSAREIDLNVLTVLPTDSIGKSDTARGFVAVEGHERRRRAAYREGYNKYLSKVQGSNTLVTRCREICRKEAGLAKKELAHYLDRLRKNAFILFDRWVDIQQDFINQEIMHDIRGPQGQYLTDGYEVYVRQFSAHYDISIPPCPPKELL